MSDVSVRELERRAAAGDVDAGALLLAARRRLGGLSTERLELAAYLGDPAARAVLLAERPLCACNVTGKTHGRECPLSGPIAASKGAPPFRIPAAFWKWIMALPAEREVIVRVGLAVHSLHPAPPAHAARERLDVALAAARAWAECPCDAHADAVRAQRCEYEVLVELRDVDGRPRAELEAYRRRVSLVARAVSSGKPVEVLPKLADVAHALGDEARVRAALRDELVPWALRSDGERPLDERCPIRTGAELRAVRARLRFPPSSFADQLGVAVSTMTRMEAEDAPLTENQRRRLGAWFQHLHVGSRVERALTAAARRQRGPRTPATQEAPKSATKKSSATRKSATKKSTTRKSATRKSATRTSATKTSATKKATRRRGAS